MKTPAISRALLILFAQHTLKHICGPSEQVPDSLKEQRQGFLHS